VHTSSTKWIFTAFI